MNRTSPLQIHRALVCFAITAGLIIPLVAIAPAVHAHAAFTAADTTLVKQVLCDILVINGQLTTSESRYAGSGTCIELQSQQEIDKATNTSQFPDVNNSKQLFTAKWTSQGTYNPMTKETWEKVTMPAPSTDEKSPIGRPYGNYETRMICATDPWLTGPGVNCTGKTVKVTGNLGDAEALLRMFNRPVTTPSKPAQLQALVAAHDRDARLQTPVTKAPDTNNRASSIAVAPKPSVVEPRDVATYPTGTPLRVRIVPAKDAKDTAYRLEIQAKVNFDWRDVITVATTAGVAQSQQGYRGWGGVQPAGARGEMTATAGVYRIRARATAPQAGQPGDWVEFKIDGQPGVQVDVMNQAKPAPGKAGDAAQSAASRATGQPGMPSSLANAPATAVQNRAGAASLNPQPLPPKASPGAMTLNPQSLTPNNLSGAASLNPQPLPPKTAPGSFPATPLPGGTPQAPSSLR